MTIEAKIKYITSSSGNTLLQIMTIHSRGNFSNP